MHWLNCGNVLKMNWFWLLFVTLAPAMANNRVTFANGSSLVFPESCRQIVWPEQFPFTNLCVAIDAGNQIEYLFGAFALDTDYPQDFHQLLRQYLQLDEDLQVRPVVSGKRVVRLVNSGPYFGKVMISRRMIKHDQVLFFCLIGAEEAIDRPVEQINVFISGYQPDPGYFFNTRPVSWWMVICALFLLVANVKLIFWSFRQLALNLKEQTQDV